MARRYVVVVVAAAATVLAVGLVAVAVQSPEAGSRAARLLSAAHKDTMEYVYMPAAAAKDANARSPYLPPSLPLLSYFLYLSLPLALSYSPSLAPSLPPSSLLLPLSLLPPARSLLSYTLYSL
jgi:hypothetical protein